MSRTIPDPGPGDAASAAMRAVRRRSRALIGVRPRTPNQLHEWLRVALSVETPRAAWLSAQGDAAACADGPLAYLCHVFFEESGGRARSRDAVVWACRGGGKTFYAAVATALELIFKPGVEVRALGGSLEQAQRMHAHLRGLFEQPAVRSLLERRPTARRLELRNGSAAEVCAQSHTSVRGARPQKLRCDEVDLFDPDVWAAALICPRSRRCGGVYAHAAVEALSTMHRPGGLMESVVARAAEQGGPALFRWSVADVLARCEPERDCGQCALWEECGGRAKHGDGHVSIDDAVGMKRRSGDTAWRVEMRCDRPRTQRQALPEFERGVHVLPADDDRPAAGPGRWIGGMDFGFADPTIFLLAQADGEGVVRVLDEAEMRETTIDRVAAEVRAVCARRGLDEPPVWIGADPAGAQRSAQTGVSVITALRRSGLAVRSRRLSVEEGLRMVRGRLRPACGGPTLFIHPRCAGLISAMERYRLAPDAGRGRSAAPIKDGPDHWADALRYMIINLDRPGASVRTYV